MNDRAQYDQAHIQQAFTSIDDQKIFFLHAGSGSPLILLHGLGGSSRWWMRTIPTLARHYRVYAPDFVGFGQSSSHKRFDLHQAADSLVRWMQHMGLHQAHIVGHSMGGFVAIDLAARFPDYVDKLVLVGAAARSNQVGTATRQPMLGQFTPQWLSQLGLLLPDLRRCSAQTMLAAVHVMLRTNLQERLTRIGAQTMVIWGEHDPMVPLALGYDLTRQLSSAELLIIKATGHIPMWEQPRIFNSELAAFLRRPRLRAE
jgi:pimeloyl-ACP methyl ester carboxylesterase